MWIESHQALREHPKTKRLARRLGVGRAQAIGHMLCLWWWAMDYALDGDLSTMDAEEIAVGAEWEGDAKAFVAAATAAGFLDKTDAGLAIHNWVYYTGRLLRNRDENRRRARESYEKKRASDKTSLRVDCAQKSADYAQSAAIRPQSTGLPTYLPTKKTATPVDNSEMTAIEALTCTPDCFVCGEEMTSMDMVNGHYQDKRGWHHDKCDPKNGKAA
jgi:hypothetical protein